MSTDLAVVNSSAIAIRMPPVPTSSEVESISQMAKIAAYSGFLNSNAGMQNTTQRAADAFFVMMMGRELGIPAMTSLKTIYVIDGQPSCSGQALLSLIRRSGVQVDIPDPGKVTDSATIKIKRPGSDWKTYTYTKQMATEAGLINRKNWTKHPREMLIWRSISTAARFECPDIVGGLYMIEEINPDIDVDQQGNPIDNIVVSKQPIPEHKPGQPVPTEEVLKPEVDFDAPIEEPEPPKQQPWNTLENIDKLLQFVCNKLHLSQTEVMGLAGVKGKDDVEGWGKYESGKAAGAAIEAAFNAVLDVAPKHQPPVPEQAWVDGIDRELLEGMILDNFTKFDVDDYKKAICGRTGDWEQFGSLNAAQQAVIDYVLKSNHPVTTQLVKRPHKNYVEFQAGRGSLRMRLYGRDQLRQLFPDHAKEIDDWKVGNDTHKLDEAIRITEYNVKDGYIEVVKIEKIDIPF